MNDPARIQRIAAAVLGCVDDFIAQTDRARADGFDPGPWLVGNVTAAEIRELAIAASQAVAPPEPVAEVVWRGNIDYSTADVGPLELASWRKVGSATWDWDVTNGDALVCRGNAATSDAAKAAAIAAARAWRDSIRL